MIQTARHHRENEMLCKISSNWCFPQHAINESNELYRHISKQRVVFESNKLLCKATFWIKLYSYWLTKQCVAFYKQHIAAIHNDPFGLLYAVASQLEDLWYVITLKLTKMKKKCTFLERKMTQETQRWYICFHLKIPFLRKSQKMQMLPIVLNNHEKFHVYQKCLKLTKRQQTRAWFLFLKI